MEWVNLLNLDMKRLVFLLFFISIVLYLPAEIMAGPVIDTLRCDSLTAGFAAGLNIALKNNNLDDAGRLIGQWKSVCGDNEINSRASILYNLRKGIGQDAAIRSYFSEDFHFVFRYRIEYAASEDYMYYFEDYRTYFDFMPLRHSLDSTLMDEAGRQLQRNDLSKDARLICRFFSGDLKKFEKEARKSEFSGSFIQQYNNNDKRYYARENMGVQVFAGAYSSFDEGAVFGLNPSVGFGLWTPLKYRFQGEFQMRFRILVDDSDFEFRALGYDHVVNSNFGFNLNVNVAYRIFENDKLTVLPKIGSGWESISTGISSYDEDTQETKYYDVSTMHTNVGITILKPIFRRNYIGLEASYHYCPYGWEKDLLTRFNNHAYSIELIFRF